MGTTNEKKVMLTDEDLDSVSGGFRKKSCKHERNNIVCKRDDFDVIGLSYEEQICPICHMHRIIEHRGSKKTVYIDWFVYSGSSYLIDNYHGHGLPKEIIQ